MTRTITIEVEELEGGGALVEIHRGTGRDALPGTRYLLTARSHETYRIERVADIAPGGARPITEQPVRDLDAITVCLEDFLTAEQRTRTEILDRLEAARPNLNLLDT